MKKLLSFFAGVLLAVNASADYFVYETTSIGLDQTMCFNRSYVGFAYGHCENIAPGQIMPRTFVIPNDGGYIILNALWLPTGNTVTLWNGLFFETVGPYSKYALVYFQGDGIHVHLNPKIYSGPWWVSCEDFGTWELTPLSQRSYDPNRLPDP